MAEEGEKECMIQQNKHFAVGFCLPEILEEIHPLNLTNMATEM